MNKLQNANTRLCLFQGRNVLQVQGGDRIDFLQGLVTNDVAALAKGEARFSALLTPQGKIFFDFFVVNTGDALLLDCSSAVSADLLKRLGFYKLRAQVTIEDVSASWRVGAAWGGEAPVFAEAADVISYADPRLAELGFRMVISGVDDLQVFKAAPDNYHAHRISLAVPEGGKDYAFGDVFPHDACLDLLHGVDFKKGCFIGQEVVSRMQHRGTGRTRVLSVSAVTPLPEGGADVTANGFPVGRLGSVSANRGVALCRIDRVADALAKGEPLMAGVVPVTLSVPAWANYTLSAS